MVNKSPRRRPSASEQSSSPSLPTDAPRPERLQKALAAAGVGSRRACEELIVTGRVTVDGKVVDQLGAVVVAETQKIAVDGQVVRAERKVYWWLNKPPGALCTSRDPNHRMTVLDLVPGLHERVYAVGRLDEESTGLVLLTNDGAMAEILTHPRYQVRKTYECLVAGRPTGETMAKMKAGVWLSDGKARVLRINRLGVKGQATRLSVVLGEGHNREIRRLFAKFGHKVMKLERVAIGPVKVRKLRVGQSRPATEDEIKLLRQTCRRALARSRGEKLSEQEGGDAGGRKRARGRPGKRGWRPPGPREAPAPRATVRRRKREA